jgi:hypothetical protein
MPPAQAADLPMIFTRRSRRGLRGPDWSRRWARAQVRAEASGPPVELIGTRFAPGGETGRRRGRLGRSCGPSAVPRCSSRPYVSRPDPSPGLPTTAGWARSPVGTGSAPSLHRERAFALRATESSGHGVQQSLGRNGLLQVRHDLALDTRQRGFVERLGRGEDDQLGGRQ